MSNLPKGTKLQGNRYTIVGTIGRGSFGIVYKAIDNYYNHGDTNLVAIKEFFMDDVNSRSGDSRNVGNSQSNLFVKYKVQFKREAEHLESLTHPSVVKVYGVFEENNTVYYVMEYIDGENLDDVIKRKPFLEDNGIELWRGICHAIAYMHSQRMLHLDLKPKNVMLRKDNTPVVIDFGMSKVFDKDGNPETSSNIGIGTKGYAPSEQADYDKDNSDGFPATMDVYALGATLYKMLSGMTPPTANEVQVKKLPIEKLEEFGISASTIDLIRNAMEPNYVKRIQTVEQLLQWNGKKTDEDETEVQKIKKEVQEKKPRKLGWPIAITIVLAALVGLLFLFQDGPNPDDPINKPDSTIYPDKDTSNSKDEETHPSDIHGRDNYQEKPASDPKQDPAKQSQNDVAYDSALYSWNKYQESHNYNDLINAWIWCNVANQYNVDISDFYNDVINELNKKTQEQEQEIMWMHQALYGNYPLGL